MTRKQRRLDRQFESLERLIPALSGPLRALRGNGWILLRVPLAIIFIAGGFLAFLPFLGLWMMPFGLLLLAVDLPFLQGPMSVLMIRARRRIDKWKHWWRGRRV